MQLFDQKTGSSMLNETTFHQTRLTYGASLVSPP